MRGKVDAVASDRAVVELAVRQHGVVARRQVLALGLGPDAVDRRVAAGRLHVVHHGVYAVGHPIVSPDGRLTAAVLAVPRAAVVSHRSAGALWGILDAAPARVDVTAAGAITQPGVRGHRATLSEDEVAARRGIPVTTAARTLLDLAAELPRHRLERAAEEAERLRLADRVSLAALLARHSRRKGVGVLRQVVEGGRLERVTRSELEARFLTFLDDHDLPPPRTNARVRAGDRTLEIDCVWIEHRVVVELDGHAFHATRAAFERDRARDRALQAAGWRVVRVTWHHLLHEPEALAADLRRLLHPTASS